jgi:hypothetical protein
MLRDVTAPHFGAERPHFPVQTRLQGDHHRNLVISTVIGVIKRSRA